VISASPIVKNFWFQAVSNLAVNAKIKLLQLGGAAAYLGEE
jgi:hypothetical protein